jgi:hypothetical protein
MTTNTEVLREIPLFRGMSDRSIEIIADIVRETSFPAGASFVREGEPGESLIIIRRAPRPSSRAVARCASSVPVTSSARSR